MMNDRGGGRGVMVMIVFDIEGELLDCAPSFSLPLLYILCLWVVSYQKFAAGMFVRGTRGFPPPEARPGFIVGVSVGKWLFQCCYFSPCK